MPVVMNQEVCESCTMLVEKPRLLFLYTFYEPTIDAGRLLSTRTGWTVREDDADKRLYDSRYVHAVPPCYAVEQAPLIIDQLNRSSLQRLVRLRKLDLPYKKLLQDHSDVLSGVTVTPMVRIYATGVVTIGLEMELDGRFDVDHIIGLVNGLLDFGLTFTTEERQNVTINSVAEETFDTLVGFLGEEKDDFKDYAKYSIILPSKIIPQMPSAKNYFSEEYERELFALAIRRAEDWRNIALPLAHQYQRNVGFMERDIVMLNVHNALIYIPEGLSPGIFIRAIGALIATVFMLKHYDLLVSKKLSEMKAEHASPQELSESIAEIERVRLDVLRALEMFRMLTAAGSFRVARILEQGRQVFGTEDLARLLMERLTALDSILENQYDAQALQQLRRIGDLIQGLLYYHGLEVLTPTDSSAD